MRPVYAQHLPTRVGSLDREVSNDDEAREHNRSRIQKDLRRRRGERAFLFDKDLSRCLGDVDRDDWEFAIAISGG